MTELATSLIEQFGRERVRFDRDMAPQLPWLFEPYWTADLDLVVEKGTIRSLDGLLDLELVVEVLDRRRGDRPVAAFQRVIRGDTAWHKSSLTFDGFQRQGIARRVLSASVDLYDSLGVRKARMNAVGVGRYAWARAGFDFDERVFGEPDSEPAALPALRELAERLGHDLGGAKSAWEIAARREEVPAGLFESRGGSVRFLSAPTDCEGPLGRVLFLCAGVWDWDGTLDLDPGSQGREQFEEYRRQ